MLEGAIQKARDAIQRRRALRFYAQFFERGDLVFDVGANVGARTAWFTDLGAKVVAIEPQRSCLELLEREYRGSSDVVIVPKALGAAPGHADLAICVEAPTISTLSSAWRDEGRFAGEFEWTRSERVEMTTLDELIAEHGLPAFCKIDVEGFEGDVLAGLNRPLPAVSFEFTREFFADAVACVARVESLGPVVASASLGESLKLVSEWCRPERLLSALAARSEPVLWGDIYLRTAT